MAETVERLSECLNSRGNGRTVAEPVKRSWESNDCNNSVVNFARSNVQEPIANPKTQFRSKPPKLES